MAPAGILPDAQVIYAAETDAGALLEMLVHASGSVPASQGFIEIEIPSALTVEVVTQNGVPGWDAPSSAQARRFGDLWYDKRRTAVLIVPSVTTRVETNILINQEHPDFAQIRASLPVPVRWDDRLWTKAQGSEKVR